MKKLLALMVAAIPALATVAPMLADSTGYEGQPGHQGGRGHNP